MQPLLKKPAVLRAKKTNALEEDALQHAWAISYSDLLMVLMSFFIIYFEMSANLQPTAVDKIIMAFKADKTVQEGPSGVGSVAQGGGTKEFGEEGGPADAPEKITYSSLSQLKTTLDGRGVSIHADYLGKGIVIDFPDHFFEAGQFNLSDEHKKSIDEIAAILKPLADEIVVTVIGHTDAQPIVHLNKKIIDSNLVLSNLRSSKVVQHLVQSGFDPHYVTSQGVGEYARNTRSFSLRITERSKR